MSISSAFQNALSGLQIATRNSDLIAQNLANATTPGYAPRQLEVASTSSNFVGGATVVGVTRLVDPGLLASRRSSDSDFGHASAIYDFFDKLETSVGTPDDPSALTNLISDFDADLVSAASRPDAPERLEAAVIGAGELVSNIQATSAAITQARTEAEASIDTQVNRLNAALEQVEYLNIQISQAKFTGQDPSSIMDMRQVVIDEIHEIVPVREVARDNDQVALFTHGGVVLLEDSAREVSFDANRLVTPYMTQSGGQLSGISVDGLDVDMGPNGGFSGGSLEAQFSIRDELGEAAMSQIDAAARNLVERFQDPSVDPTLLAGDAGLFTDNGGSFDSLDEVGLAERISVNAIVDPAQGGDAWKLRDGLNAVTPGSVGQSSTIQALRGALNAQTAPASGDFGTGNASFSDLANTFLSEIGLQRLTSEQNLSFAATSNFELTQAELANGVDSDSELQNLLLVEQLYAANARVINTLDEMMDTLLRLGT